MNSQSNIKVKGRNERFAQKVATRIIREIPSEDNPYIAERCLIRGYDQLELARKRSFSDVVFLLLRGELPIRQQGEFFETLLVALCHPGPRHAATRAAMNAGAGKSSGTHILPIALSVLGGAHLGGEEVEASMRFIRKNRRKTPQAVAEECVQRASPCGESDFHIAPGFGRRFGDIDRMPQQVADVLLALEGAGKAMRWCAAFVAALNGHGWLATSVAAAAFVDLGFHPRAGAGLYQLIASPGVFAHGVELHGKPMTALPFIDDEHYFIEEG